MNPKSNFHEASYKRHAEHFNEYSHGGSKEDRAKTWLETDTVDAWLHRLMFQAIDPLLEADPKARWLTVGDGRYGKDAKYILDKGFDVLATDISDVLLRQAKNIGYINNYKKENAECLSLNDSEFDYVFCKESYHHFPRPMLALHEMLRVANKGVVLIEPNDPYINKKFTEKCFVKFKNIVKNLIGKEVVKHNFELAGNYIYSISRREIEKVALGLNYSTVSFKGINLSYIDGVENEKLSENGPMQKKVKRDIALKNLLCEIGLIDYKLLVAIIFKHDPSEIMLTKLSEKKYETVKLPDNPYLSS